MALAPPPAAAGVLAGSDGVLPPASAGGQGAGGPGIGAVLGASGRAADGAGPSPRRLRLRDASRLRSARERAAAVVEQARRQAEEALRQARREGFEVGFREGLQQGREQAREEVRREARELLERLQALVEDALRRREQALREAEADIVELALAVAEKVVHRQVEEGPEVTRAVLHSLLALEGLAASAGRVEVHVNPQELEWLARGPADALRPDGPVHIEWVPDPGVSPGGCVVESDLGIIDASLETRLSAVREALRDGVRHGHRR